MPSKTFQYGSFPLTEANGVLVEESGEMRGSKRAMASASIAGGRGISILRNQQLEKVVEVGGVLRAGSPAALITLVRSFQQSMLAELNAGKQNLQVQNDDGTFVYDDAVLVNPDTLVEKELGYHTTFIPFRALFACPKGFARDLNTTKITQADITGVPYTNSVVVNGNTNPEPILRFTFDLASTIQEVTFTNLTTNESITVSNLSLADTDVLEIDTGAKTVRHNTVLKKFTGIFPTFVPGTNNYQLTVAGSSNIDQQQTAYDSERSVYDDNYLSQKYEANAGAISQIAVLLKKVTNVVLQLFDDFNDNSKDAAKWNTLSGTVDEEDQVLKVRGSELALYDDFSGSLADWNTSGDVTIQSGRMRLNAIGQTSTADTDGKTPGGKPSGDQVLGCEFYFNAVGGGPEGTDRRFGITNGPDYIRLKTEHAAGFNVRWETGGVFSGGGGAWSVSSGTVKIIEEDGAVKVYQNGSLAFTARASGGMPANMYMWAQAPQISGSENYLEIDNVKFYQGLTSEVDTDGKTNGDPIGGAEWYQEHIGGTHADDGTIFTELTNGTDYIRFQHDVINGEIDIVLGGAYGSGTVATVLFDNGTFNIDQSTNNIVIQRNGSTVHTIQNKVLQDNTHFRAKATVTTPGNDHYLQLDNVKFAAQFNQQKDLDVRLETDSAGDPSGDLIEQERTGTAQAGASNTITLDAGASATDDTYNEMEIEITGGTGLGQRRIVNDYVGSSKVATVHKDWTTQPDATSTFEIRNGRVAIPITEISTSSFNEHIKGLLNLVTHAASTPYHLVLKQLDDGGDASNYIQAKVNTAGGYANGNVETTTDGGASWSDVTAEDLYFKLWSTLPTSFNIDFDFEYNPSYLSVV